MEYRFGVFRLSPPTRELWQEDQLVHVPRRAFDCLAYLIEHRDRAVGRDELVAALWGRVDATDSQVNQVVLRARLAVGDDGQDQHAIRTVPGFGYRWVMAVVAHATDDSESTASALPSPISAESATRPADRRLGVQRQRLALWLSLSLCALLIALAVAFIRVGARRSSPPADARATAVVVLPLDVSAPREAGWVRLGAMDLIADRLRSAGLPVPASDSVVSAVHTVGEPLDSDHLANLQRTLGAAITVRGSATRSATGWRVELSASTADGAHFRETSEQNDVTEAARRAADLLLAALGHKEQTDAVENQDLQELLQQAQAALLASELDTARAILNDAPMSLQKDPQVRAKLAQIDFRAGRFDSATTVLDELLDDPVVIGQPRLHAQALTTRGFVDIRREECASAEHYFDTAVSALAGQPSAREGATALAARGLARACEHKFESAATDLGKARTAMDEAGDRMGVARVNNYLGVLEVERNRNADAVPYFVAAADTAESFGVFETLRANLTALFIAQAHLLQWPDALVTSERLWKLRDRIHDPELLLATSGFRVRVLTALGHYREADTIVAEAERTWPDVKGASTRFYHAARAELSWHEGDAATAFAAATKALEVWPRSVDPDLDGYATVALLQQRASIALGKAVSAELPHGDTEGVSASNIEVPSALLVAQAERAAREGRDGDAEQAFRAASATAEAEGVADSVALTAEAYAAWLLAHHRSEDAGAQSGRIAAWADRDFDCAILQVRVFHDAHQIEAWKSALDRAQRLAGERTLPADLLKPPSF